MQTNQKPINSNILKLARPRSENRELDQSSNSSDFLEFVSGCKTIGQISEGKLAAATRHYAESKCRRFFE